MLSAVTNLLTPPAHPTWQGNMPRRITDGSVLYALSEDSARLWLHVRPVCGGVDDGSVPCVLSEDSETPLAKFLVLEQRRPGRRRSGGDAATTAAGGNTTRRRSGVEGQNHLDIRQARGVEGGGAEANSERILMASRRTEAHGGPR